MLLAVRLLLCSGPRSGHAAPGLYSLLTPSPAELTSCSHLLHPMGLSAFLQGRFEGDPFLMRRGADFHHFLPSADDLDELLLTAFGSTPLGKGPTEDTVLEGQGKRWKLVRRVHRAGAWRVVSFRNASVTLGRVHDLFLRGFSLVVNRAQLSSPSIRQVTHSLTQCLGLRVSGNLYLTPPNSTAFEAHMDWMDGLVLQVQGTKLWKLWSPGLVAYPRPDLMRSPYNGTSILSSLSSEEVLLHPGDLLYVPRGLAHEASTTASALPSLHITFGIEAATHFTPQILLHHALRLYSLHAASSDGLVFYDDTLRPRVEVPKDQVEHFLHICLHCAASSNDYLRRALRITHVKGVLDPDIPSLFRESRAILSRNGFDELMRCALREELLEVYIRSGWVLIRRESLQLKEKPSIAYVSRFLKSSPCSIILDIHRSDNFTADMARGHYGSDALSRIFSADAYQLASKSLAGVWNISEELLRDSWESFFVDARHHMELAE